MSLNSNATEDTAIGYQAMSSDQSGLANTAIGYQSLINNTSGGNNTAIGGNAMGEMDTGSFNVAIGNSALFWSEQGASGNTGVGYSALKDNVPGSGNVAIGFQAGQIIGASQSSGSSYNVAIGYNVASTTLLNGNNNILIGTNSGVDTPTSSTSNFLNIGNLIYGTGLGTSGTTPAGNVGIGRHRQCQRPAATLLHH